MDFIDVIKALGEKVNRLKDSIHTEEATKNAFVMPFIAALGYDVFNPLEVVPEFIADLGIKKGEGRLLYSERWEANYHCRMQALERRTERP